MDGQFDHDGYEHGIDFKHNNNIGKPIGYDNGLDDDFHTNGSEDYGMNGDFDDHTESFSEQIQSITQDLVHENKAEDMTEDSIEDQGLEIDARNLNESVGQSPDGKTHTSDSAADTHDVIVDGRPDQPVSSAAPDAAPSDGVQVADVQTQPTQTTDHKAGNKSTPVKKDVKSKLDTRSPVTSAKTRPQSANTAAKTASTKVAAAKPKPEPSSTVPKHTKTPAPSSAKSKDATATGDSKTAPNKAPTANKKTLSASSVGRPQSGAGGHKKETTSATLNKTITHMRASADVTKKDKDTAGLNRTVLGTSSVATSKPGSAGLRKKPEDKGEQKSTGAAARVGSAPHSAGPRKQLHTGPSTGPSKEPVEAGVNGSTAGKKEPKKPVAVVKPTTPSKPKENKPTPRPNSGVNTTQSKANTTVSKTGTVATDKRPASGTSKPKPMDTKTPAPPGDKKPASASNKPASAAKTGAITADKAHNTTVSAKKPTETTSSATTKPRLNSASKKPTDKPESAKSTSADSKQQHVTKPADKQPHNKPTNEQAVKAAAKVTSKPTSATNKPAAKQAAGQAASAKDAKHGAAKPAAKTGKQDPKKQPTDKVEEKPANPETACLTGDKGNPHYAKELEQGATIENTDLQQATVDQTSAVGQGQVEGQVDSEVISTIAHITGKFGNPHYLEELTREDSSKPSDSDTFQSEDAPHVEHCYTEYHYKNMPELSDEYQTEDNEQPLDESEDYPEEMHYHNIPQPKVMIPCKAETISQQAAAPKVMAPPIDNSVLEAVELLIQSDKADVTGDKGNPHYAAELENSTASQIVETSVSSCKAGQDMVEDKDKQEEAHPTGDKGNPYYKAELEQSTGKPDDVKPTENK